MSFITAGYRNATPSIQCPGKGFKGIFGPFHVGKSTKYRLVDDDGYSWVMYVNPVPGIVYDARAFRPVGQHTIVGPANFKGTIQIAKNPLREDGEALYDKATGSFVAEATLTGTVNNSQGTYTIAYTKVGSSPLLMFVLPHHLQSLDPTKYYKITKLQLRTTTKGMATAVWAESLSFSEPNLPTTMGYAPWIPGLTPAQQKTRFSTPTMEVLTAAADKDLRTMLSEKVPNDSMYYAGKTFAKWATLCFVMRETLAHQGFPAAFDHLKTEFAKYVDNRQKYPLYYDDSWKGLVSNAGFNDPGADFGNTYYNDHHFHYGYFVYAASIIATLEPGWLVVGDSKQWVNGLVKDYAESDYTGRDYPFSRNFDWWHGHSWAKGLFESADGKDEESTSEDGFASFAVSGLLRVKHGR
jgi:endo-1,3(4)-beta-glucanase